MAIVHCHRRYYREKRDRVRLQGRMREIGHLRYLILLYIFHHARSREGFIIIHFCEFIFLYFWIDKYVQVYNSTAKREKGLKIKCIATVCIVMRIHNKNHIILYFNNKVIRMMNCCLSVN